MGIRRFTVENLPMGPSHQAFKTVAIGAFPEFQMHGMSYYIIILFPDKDRLQRGDFF